MNEKYRYPYSAHFSPETIRERYKNHLEKGAFGDTDPLLSIVEETIRLMRQEGRTEPEIQKRLVETFQLSARTAEEMLKKTA